ncbi:formimidoylglutamase [Cytobacillus horneckiae]|uniref:formimidoylglutamase n=1 Tax=Cytobacillus horneckiae TaxID=549687 RepID=UPI0039A2F980
MYIQPSLHFWTGRVDSETDERSFRYHQVINTSDPCSANQKSEKSIRFIGFKSDEGVRRNKGRVGAGKAPDEIRKSLAKLPWHLQASTSICDCGDVVCDNGKLEEAQAELGQAVSGIIQGKGYPIILGGGHETFYGHYLGVRSAIGEHVKLGMINIDAHFDLRSYDKEPTSGTMFKQILDHDKNSSYFCAGIQKQGNTLALFDEAKRHGVEFILEEQLTNKSLENSLEKMDDFIDKNDVIILTLCMDSISSAYAPGVSAPSPFGLAPDVVREIIRKVVSHPKTISFDVSEVNPSLDHSGQTVLLAAHLINEAIINFHE